MKERDHSTASVATLRAELADLRPRLAKAERERDDAQLQTERLAALCNKLKAERDALKAKYGGKNIYLLPDHDMTPHG